MHLRAGRKSLVEADESARAVLMTSLSLLLLHEGTARRSGPSQCYLAKCLAVQLPLPANRLSTVWFAGRIE